MLCSSIYFSNCAAVVISWKTDVSVRPTRLKLKQIYGAKPEDDLCKMKPTAEQHEEIKKMRAENTVIDLEKLGTWGVAL